MGWNSDFGSSRASLIGQKPGFQQTTPGTSKPSARPRTFGRTNQLHVREIRIEAGGVPGQDGEARGLRVAADEKVRKRGNLGSPLPPILQKGLCREVETMSGDLVELQLQGFDRNVHLAR